MNPELQKISDYPFTKLDKLLKDIPSNPSYKEISLVLGEPYIEFPKQASEIIKNYSEEFNIYPTANRSSYVKKSFKKWINNRFPNNKLNVEDNNLVLLSGSKEGLFMAPKILFNKGNINKNLVILPNPYYQAYKGACLLNGCTPYYLNATSENNFQPCLSELSTETLENTLIAYICTPSNPQGFCMEKEKIINAINLAKKYNFTVIFDECYLELYYNEVMPYSAFNAVDELGGSFENVIISHTLSKRSSAAGLRSAVMTADSKFVSLCEKYRRYSAPVIPNPSLMASSFLWEDEDHVMKNREYYKLNINKAYDKLLDKATYGKPEAGFFFWIQVKDELETTKQLWREKSIKVLPGSYLGETVNGYNPAKNHIRVSITHLREDIETGITHLKDYI